MYRVIVIEEDSKTNAMLKNANSWLDEGFLFCGEADKECALKMVEETLPDIALVNCDLWDRGLCAVIGEMRMAQPCLQVIFMTAEKKFEKVQDAVYVGASMLIKPFRTAELALKLKEASTKTKVNQIAFVENYSGNNNLMRKVLLHIYANYYKNITLTSVAQAVHISTWHLSRMVHIEMGCGFSHLLNGVRLWYAKQLLQTTDLHMYEISERVGYAETAHFSSIFKQKTGYTPNTYRREFHLGHLIKIIG